MSVCPEGGTGGGITFQWAPYSDSPPYVLSGTESSPPLYMVGLYTGKTPYNLVQGAPPPQTVYTGDPPPSEVVGPHLFMDTQ